jgi:MFS family permease
MNPSPLSADTKTLLPDAPPPSPGGRFGRLPHLAGRSFIPLGLFARLPLAMLTVGALTLVTSATGSYALGGTAAGAVGIGSALGAPVIGALADRRGQRPVLLVAAVLNALAVLGLIGTSSAVPAGGSFPVALMVTAFLAGASCPQVGPLARVRWMALTSRGKSKDADRDLDTALSYEGTADELTFVLGPALVGILASAVAPWLPLALAVVMTITLVPAFAVHPTHKAVPLKRASAPGAAEARAARIPAAVAVPVLAMVAMGTFFGSTQAALSSFSASFATAEIAGLLYAVLGVSSAAAALSVAYWPRSFTPAARWMVSAALMAGLALLLFVPASLGGMVGVLLALGLPVGPIMVTVFSIGGIVAPAERLGTVMTALASGIVAGTALGASVAGHLAQHNGYQAAFAVPAAAAGALCLLGVAAAAVLRKHQG